MDLEPMQRLHGRSGVLMTLGVCYYAAKSILDELETTGFSLGQTDRQIVTSLE